jgi:hypothetical protein
MPKLAFQIRGAEPACSTAAPAVALHLEISNTPQDQAIQTLLLTSQIQIEAARRRYSAAEEGHLRDLFGERERWGRTLRPLLWTNLTTTVPGFTGSIGIKLEVPCTFDLDVTASKYFYGVDSGTVPIVILFSGTVFYRAAANLLQAAPIPWNTEARFALPAGIWKECTELHCPNTAWLGLRKDNFERLYDFKIRHGLATFDEAVERMLAHALEAKV